MLVYVVVTALLFRNLLPDLTTHVHSDLGDPLLCARVVPGRALAGHAGGLCAASVLRRYPRHARMVLALLALPIVAEGWFAGGAMPVPRSMREGAVPQGAVVLGLPMEQGAWNAVPQYRAVVGGYRAVNGYSGYEPAHFHVLRRAIADLEPDALDGYRRVADLYVIARPDLAPPIARWIETRPGAEHLFDVDDARVYRRRSLVRLLALP